jgi:DNA-binding CsgD family transcriptional regulator/MFS family permease
MRLIVVSPIKKMPTCYDWVMKKAKQNSTEEGIGQEASLAQALLQLWPALPYLGLGLFLAWPFLAYSGGVWLSDIEINGENISRLFITSSIALAIITLAAAILSSSLRDVLKSRAALIGAGLLGCAGSIAIILGGPYYLGQFLPFNPNPVFLLGAICTGISSGVLILHSGILYSKIPPRRALLYTALAHLLVAFIYFVVIGAPAMSPVIGGPPITGIIAFVVLLPLSGFLLSLYMNKYPSEYAGGQQSSLETLSDIDARNQELAKVRQHGNAPLADGLPEYEHTPVNQSIEFRQLPGVFWKFIIALLLFSTIVSMMRSIIVEIHPVDVTLSSSSIMMLLRIVMAATFIVVAVHARTRYLNFGKVFSLIAIAIVIAIALLPSLGVLDVNWNLIIGTAIVVFEFILWCILTIIAHQKRIEPMIIYGFGYGSYMLGCTLGWFIGVFGLTVIVDSPFTSVLYLLLAGTVLAIALVLFSERDFERLFSPISESELSFESLMHIELTGSHESSTPVNAQQDEARHRGHFNQAMDKLAENNNLSVRESEVLRYLAMGRGSDFIAEQMQVSWNTARSHIHNVYVKLDVHSRKELMDCVDNMVAQYRKDD